MSKFLQLTVDLLLYDSVTPSNDPADSIRLKTTMSDLAVTAASRQCPIALANGATNQSVPLPGSPTNLLIISTDQTISAAINGAAPIVLNPTVSGKKTTVYLARGLVTSLALSNSSGATANVDVIAAVG